VTDVNTTAGAVGWENAPGHYRGSGGIENFDVWDAYILDPYSANAFKYLARWNKKGSALNDLKKALHYIDETILRWEAGRLPWGVIPLPELTPEKIIDAFGLDGQVATAVRCLLLWRVEGESPAHEIHAARLFTEAAIEQLESTHAA
jgi:hypothetical protein